MKNFFGFVISVLLGVLIILALKNTTNFPAFGYADISQRVSAFYTNATLVAKEGIGNLVTAIVLGYRGFDTLGEVTVLFISAIGVSLVLGTSKKTNRLNLSFKANFMLRVGSKVLFSIILITSMYIILHGHVTPGGGFPGGAIIASAMLLLYLADDKFRSNIKGFKVLESLAGILFVVVGLLGFVLATYFLQNYLPAGTFAKVISGGILPIIYMLIALKVGSEISGVIDNFLTEEESE